MRIGGIAPRDGGIGTPKDVAAGSTGETHGPADTGTGAVNPTASHQHPGSAPAAAKQADLFGLSGAVSLEDVPAGRFHNQLARLSEPSRRRALDKLGALQVPLNDVASLSADNNGQLFYQCSPPPLPSGTEFAGAGQAEAQATPSGTGDKIELAAAVPIASPPLRHSRPGATRVIYLDFNGHSITGTAWNMQRGNDGDPDYRPAVTTYVAKVFDTDGDPSSFSDSEQTAILRIWERVAEDFIGFNVDVTTEEPATFTRNTGRILITNNVDANGVNMPSSTAAGVGYLDVFGDFNYATYYSPALVYANQLSNSASYIAEAASHEMGHNLSLSHDGTTGGNDYYTGHGSGENSWNTIMGASTSRNVTQWSKGEYYNANNPEDDLALIASYLGYAADDFTDSNATASALTVNGTTVSGTGVISQTGEADRFSFVSGGGAITITATTFRSASQSHGGNLDIALELYNSAGTLVASADVDGVKNATLSTTVSSGTYYLRVLGGGSGTPQNSTPSGYTSYGSLGQYTISGTVIASGQAAPVITTQPVSRTVTIGSSVTFTVAASGSPTPTFQWKKNGSNIAGATGSSYAIGSVAAGSVGNYTVVATNAAGSVTSNVAVLSLVVAPSNAVISITPQ